MTVTMAMPEKIWPHIRRTLAALHEWVFDRRVQFVKLALGAIILIFALEVHQNWGRWLEIDWLMVSGFPVGLAFICATNSVRDRFERMVGILSERGLVRFLVQRDGRNEPEEDPTERLRLRNAAEGQIEEDAALWGVGVSLVFVPLCLFVASELLAMDPGGKQVLVYLTVVAMALVCGLRLGRMACYGWQGLYYKTLRVKGRQIAVWPQLGHPDGSSGLAPVGEFYHFQVGTMFWLIGYLVVWLAILGIVPQEDVWFSYSQETQFGLFLLFLVVFALQVAGFLLPMWSIHRELRRFQRQQKDQAESRYRELSDVRDKLDQAPGSVNPDEALHALFLRNHYDDVRTMPRWPVAYGTMFNFWLGRFFSGGIAVAAFFGDLPSVMNFFAEVAGLGSGA